MAGTEYECKDCGRAFLIYDEEKKRAVCPSCESENIGPKGETPLPSWLLAQANAKPR